MFSQIKTDKSTKNFSDKLGELKFDIERAEALVIGAGAGLSTAAGFNYDGERFKKYFSDFEERYEIHDMYYGGFYPFQTAEEFWAWWSRHILINRYDCPVGETYLKLLALIKDMNYFVITTNVDHQFQRAGFDEDRLFCCQGDYGLFQCSKPCSQTTYENEDIVRDMYKSESNMKIDSSLVPTCPKCGRPLTLNLRCDDTFVEDELWHQQKQNYENFLKINKKKNVLFLELGVGFNTPIIIKYPFWRMTSKNSQAKYVCVNQGEACFPPNIENQSLAIDANIADVLNALQ